MYKYINCTFSFTSAGCFSSSQRIPSTCVYISHSQYPSNPKKHPILKPTHTSFPTILVFYTTIFTFFFFSCSSFITSSLAESTCINKMLRLHAHICIYTYTCMHACIVSIIWVFSENIPPWLVYCIVFSIYTVYSQSMHAHEAQTR